MPPAMENHVCKINEDISAVNKSRVEMYVKSSLCKDAS